VVDWDGIPSPHLQLDTPATWRGLEGAAGIAKACRCENDNNVYTQAVSEQKREAHSRVVQSCSANKGNK
jgi:hypothetical protein